MLSFAKGGCELESRNNLACLECRVHSSARGRLEFSLWETRVPRRAGQRGWQSAIRGSPHGTVQALTIVMSSRKSKPAAAVADATFCQRRDSTTEKSALPFSAFFVTA